MVALTARAENLIAHVQAIKANMQAVLDYCTEECDKCPLRGYCDRDGWLDYMDDGLESIERMADYLDYYDRVTERREIEQFEDATGVDAGWYMFNDDRSDTDR